MGGKYGRGESCADNGVFLKLENPRSEINKLHPLETVVAITILAVMSFAKGREAMEDYAKAKKDWLAKFPDMPNGVPSHDVYRRVFIALKSEAVEECFVNRVGEIKKEYGKEVIPRGGISYPVYPPIPNNLHMQLGRIGA
ncbi:hypothetical protein FACS189494_10690 [Spirochaetia bacterium]|nr:hypothetical protein FACS189494_10690 [Spirochaetia bacterium]